MKIKIKIEIEIVIKTHRVVSSSFLISRKNQESKVRSLSEKTHNTALSQNSEQWEIVEKFHEGKRGKER